MYYNGQGVTQSYAESLHWYRKAADKGNANAQYALGSMYGNGEGVPQDYGEAISWSHKAADHGNVEAQYALGNVYRDGVGVTRDYAEAFRWYRIATDQGDKRAQHALSSMYCRGRGTPLVRLTSIAVVLLALPILVVPQRRWGRAKWIPWTLCSAMCAILTAHELSLSALSSAVLALGPLGPLWGGFGHALLIAILGGGSAISALAATRGSRA